MPEYLAPGVFVEEVSFRNKTIEGVGTSTAGFVGATRFGPTSGEPELLTNLSDFERIYGVNLIGTYQMVRAALPALKKAESASVVNTSSIAGVEGQIGQVAYAASKGGVAGMTLPVARDLARDGIRCMTIMPGLFHTPMFDTLPDGARDALAATVPYPSRLGNPAEYAATVRHIVENVMLNGSIIRLDGAIRLEPR